MKHRLNKLIRRSAGAGLLCLLALSSGLPAARAGLTFELQIYQSGSQGNHTYNFIAVPTD